MKKTIKVFDLCGEYCIDENDVKNLSQVLIDEIRNGYKVELDFSEVDTVLTAFLNSVIGDLFEEFDYNIIKQHFTFTEDTSKAIKEKFYRSLENAKNFYESPKEKQEEIKERVRKIFIKEIDVNEPIQHSSG